MITPTTHYFAFSPFFSFFSSSHPFFLLPYSSSFLIFFLLNFPRNQGQKKGPYFTKDVKNLWILTISVFANKHSFATSFPTSFLLPLYLSTTTTLLSGYHLAYPHCSCLCYFPLILLWVFVHARYFMQIITNC